MHFNQTPAHTKPNTFWPWVTRLHCLACCMLLLWCGTDSCVELKINISMNPHFERVRKKPYRWIKDIFLWSHIVLNIEKNICMRSFPVPLVAYELICHKTQISQHYHKTRTSSWDWNPNNVWRYMMTCTVSSKFYSTRSPLKTGAIWKE